MSTDRKAKKRKEEERKSRQRARWVETYERILPLVGAKDLFQRLPETIREEIRRQRFPSPEISIGDDFNQASERENVREAVARALHQFTFKTSDGHEIVADDFFRVVLSLWEVNTTLQAGSLDGPFAPWAPLITQTRAKLTDFIVNDVFNGQIGRLFADM